MMLMTCVFFTRLEASVGFYRLLENGLKYTNKLLVLGLSTKMNINYFHYSQTITLIGFKVYE